MQNSWSYIRNSEDVIDKTNRIKNILKDAILVTADVTGLYLCIPHVAGLKALDGSENKSVLTKKLLKMEFVLKNNVFEFNGTVKKLISRTAIGTKCAPNYAWIFMGVFETSFIKSQEKPLVWFRYIDDICFIWTHGEDKLKHFRTS